MSKLISSIITASFLLSLAAFPAGAQVTQTNSCTLGKNIDVNIVVSGADNDVIKIYSGSLVSDTVDPSPAGAPTVGSVEMNGGNPTDDSVTHANIKVRIKKDDATEVDAGKGASKAVPTASLSAIANEWGIICLMNTINTIINWISIIVLLLSTGLIIYAGFLWMTGADNPEFKQRSGKVLLAALIGFGIVILARVLPAVISGILL